MSRGCQHVKRWVWDCGCSWSCDQCLYNSECDACGTFLKSAPTEKTWKPGALTSVKPVIKAELDYAEAKRLARKMLGAHADVELVANSQLPFFPARVGVWVGRTFLMVGAGRTYREALDDAKKNAP